MSDQDRRASKTSVASAVAASGFGGRLDRIASSWSGQAMVKHAGLPGPAYCLLRL